MIRVRYCTGRSAAAASRRRARRRGGARCSGGASAGATTPAAPRAGPSGTWTARAWPPRWSPARGTAGPPAGDDCLIRIPRYVLSAPRRNQH